MLNNWIIAPEFVAALIMVLLLLYVRGSLDSHNNYNRFFYLTIWVALIGTVINIITCLFIINVFIHPLWIYSTFQHLFFMTAPLTPLFISVYVLSHLNEKMGGNTKWLGYIKLIVLLYALYFVAVVMDWLSGLNWFFTVSEKGEYIRGPYNSFAVLLSLFIVAVDIVYTLRYRKIFPFQIKKVITLFEVVFIMLIVVLIVFPNVQIAGTIALVALLVFYMSFHSVALTTDSLTNIPNSEPLYSMLSYLFSKNRDFSVVAINIRDFKGLNRQYGFKVGDTVLSNIANRIQMVPNLLFSCRFNNDRFVILGPSLGNEKYNEFFEQLSFKLEEPFTLEEFYFPFHLDYNLVTIDCPKISKTMTDTVTLISYSLSLPHIDYSAIRENSHIYYLNCDEKIQKSIYRKEYVSSVLREALDEDKLKCAYQPIFDKDGKYTGMSEALARLYDELTGKFISPGEFIPIAEANGQIHKIGKIMLLKALGFISSEIAKGHEPPVISINFSFLQFYNANYVDAIIDSVRDYNIPPHCLKIEITESYINSSLNIHSIMARFLSFGIGFYIDDFGTGYSSFDRLFDLKFEKVKFDRELLLSVTSNDKTRKVVSTLIRTFKDFDIKIIFEGVETKDQFEGVKSIGSDYIQGYYFSYPIIETEFGAWIDKQLMKE